jgi:hypothetical protein
MTQKVIIEIVLHPNGQFSVVGHESTVFFRTRQQADGYAQRLQAEAGGPDTAKITVQDLTREVST